jgi:hypothetical protein
MLKSIKQIAQETQIETQIQSECFFCKLPLTSDDFKEDKIIKTKNFIAHTLCADKAVKDYWTPKILSALDPREPFLNTEDYHETCEWCGHITDFPNETHVCPERV